jgi:hypothetical protein
MTGTAVRAAFYQNAKTNVSCGQLGGSLTQAGDSLHRLFVSNSRKETDMTTGRGPAKKAGKELRSNQSTKVEKTVAGSDLAQAPRKPTPLKPKKK